MEERHQHALLGAAAVAMVTIALARASVPAAAVWTAAATLAALARRPYAAGLAALPTLLAALPPPPAFADRLPPGPVRVQGTVVAVRRDPLLDDRAVLLATAGGQLWLRVHGDLSALPGDRLTAVARCSAGAVPGERCTVRAAREACTITAGPPQLPRLCAAARAALEDCLLRLVPGERGALLANLVLGSATSLPDDVAAAHRATGLSHLLAVSGTHAAMLAWLLGLQPFGGGRRRPVRRAHLVAALLLLVVYGAITGLEPPVFRALCSYALAAAGLQFGRRMSTVQGLAWPILASAIAAPAGALRPSFCLSYAAVAGLALAGPPRDGALEHWLLAPIRGSLWATVATAPLTLFWFGQIAPWTIVLTPLLAPLVAAMLFWGLGGALLVLLVPGAGVLVAAPLRALTDAYLAAVAAADTLPLTPIFATASPPWPLLAAGAALGGATVLLGRSRRATLLGCLFASAPHYVPLPQPPAALRLFAVGHGQACLCTLADGSTLAIDCGSLQHAVLPAQKIERALPRRCIDMLVLTHGDRDHTGAVVELLRRVPVRRAVLPAALHGTAVHRALVGAGCACELLPPGTRGAPLAGVLVSAPAPASTAVNDGSLWVRIDLPGLRVLATGDAEAPGVRWAIAHDVAAPADVLVLPHHGRPNAAGAELLDRVAPACCLVSDQQADGLSELGALAHAHGAATFATGVSGDLLIQCAAGAPVLTPVGGLPLRRRP